MKPLLAYLAQYSQTVTIYDFMGTDEQLRELVEWLNGYGTHVQIAQTELASPNGVAVLHRDGEIRGACSVESLLSRVDFETETDTEQLPDDFLSALSADVTVKSTLTVTEMVRISRDFERRALREGSGTLHAGFQQLSQIAHSKRTLKMYTALADKGVDVTVYGSPDTTLDDVPFTVVPDEKRELNQYWFLLYDGNGNPHRKAALVSKECLTDEQHVGSNIDQSDTASNGSYDGYFTTEPEIVDELFERARENAPLLRI